MGGVDVDADDYHCSNLVKISLAPNVLPRLGNTLQTPVNYSPIIPAGWRV